MSEPHLPRVTLIMTPTGALSIMRDVAARLLKEGVISGDLNGTLHANDAATVKAAMMLHGVCDFCSSPGIEHSFDVPDFDMPFAGTSTGGWAACGPCGEFVMAGKRKELFARAVDSLAFAKFTKGAIQDLHNRFWRGLEMQGEAQGMAEGLAQFVENKLPTPDTLAATITDRDKRLEAISRLSGLTVVELEQVVAAGQSKEFGALPGPLVTKLVAWHKKFGQKIDAHALLDLVGVRKPLPVIVPHWQAALDAKFAAMTMLHSMLTTAKGIETFKESVDLNDKAGMQRLLEIAAHRQNLKALSVDEDYRILRSAQAYSFSAETEAAIREASQSIPHDAPLSSIETPNTGSGWFWFSDPLPIASAPVSSDYTHALLWAWTNGVPGLPDQPALVFSAYVKNDKKDGLGGGDGKIYPSARWFWPLSMSFHDMLGYNTLLWRDVYGPGKPLEKDPNVIGEAHTRHTIADLSLFFVMACVWFRQTVPGQPKKIINPVLTQQPGHIERHARKRYQREFKLPDTPTVQVVALRKTARTEAAEAPAERVAGAREYHCRWIVAGHPRLQACGPGRKDRKLIWIDAHPAGPEDKPFRTKTKVFAVVR